MIAPGLPAGEGPNDWVVVPDTPEDIAQAVQQARRLVTRRALVAAGVSAVPIPGLDWLTDVGVLMRVIPEINRVFGLSPEQIERLSPDRRVAVFKAVSAGGGLLVGKLVTRDVLLAVLRRVGVRLTAQQAARYVPIAGSIVSATLTFSALKVICEQHIRQCAEVARRLALPSPEGPVSRP